MFLHQFGNFNVQQVKLMHDGKELEQYQSFYQAKVKNNDMLMIKVTRPSNIQGSNSQKNVNSNYLGNQGGGFPWTRNNDVNMEPQKNGRQQGSLGQYNQIAQSNQDNRQSRASYNGQQPLSNQFAQQNRSNQFGQQNHPQSNQFSQNNSKVEAPISEYEIAMQNQIEKKIHFDRMDKNL